MNIGEWTREDLISNSKDGNGKKYFLEILDSSLKPQIDDIDVIWDQLGKYIIVYVFECIKCNKITAIVQSF
ncbi:hypothetical protein CBC_0328 [Clostridium botulinum C str. Eklund]|nr:hypothetical protein CBC_0328 [Clostridium botulinum C str. Eklund]NEZ50022.1 hypothetical protein [Clostridium botulinum]